MQLLMMDVTGKPFPALMQDLGLGPAGMTHSTFEQTLPAARARRPAPTSARASRASDTEMRMTSARSLRSRMKRKFQVRF